MSDKNMDLVLIFLGYVGCIVISWLAGASHEANKVYDTHSIVTSTNTEKVHLDNGLDVKNKGFNVGDTLVIIKK